MRHALLVASVVASMLWMGCHGSHEDHPTFDPPACPSGDFPTDVPEGGDVLYVLAAAPGGGDGSMESPFAAIGEALAVASPGSVVAIGRGVYEEEVHLSDGISLVGACVAETILTSTVADEDRAVVYVEGTETAVRNLTIGPSPGSGVIAMGAGRDAVLADVAIVDHEFAGVWAGDGGRIDVIDFHVSRSLCGALFDVDGELDLHEGLITECAIGACVRECVADFGARVDRVAFQENVVNLESTFLPASGLGTGGTETGDCVPPGE